MKSNNYVVIQGWMCNELQLKGNELLIFALIYGFSQDEVSKFHGTRQYIADTFNISRPTVDKALQGLLDKQYICKEGFDDFVNPNIYWINFEVVKNLYMGCKESLQGGCKESLQGGCKESLLNNTNKQTTKVNKQNNSKELLQNSNFNFGNYSKPKKESLYSKCMSLIYNKTEDEKVRHMLADWLSMLLEKYRSRGKVLYVNVFKGKLSMLDKYDEKDWKEIIEYNLQKGYEGFYPLPAYQNNSDVRKGKAWEEGISCDTYTEEEKRQIEKDREEMEARGERVWY